jgi:hypothetical protein
MTATDIHARLAPANDAVITWNDNKLNQVADNSLGIVPDTQTVSGGRKSSSLSLAISTSIQSIPLLCYPPTETAFFVINRNTNTHHPTSHQPLRESAGLEVREDLTNC